MVTPALVLSALRRIGLPALRVHTQPAPTTLVNLATIFYTRPHRFTATIRLLGQPVRISAGPTRYTWHHGDATVATSTGPGAPYPAMAITHTYTHAHVSVQTSVDVTYSGRYRVAGGAWVPIPGTVTITGPTKALRIAEATPVLSGNY